MHTRLHPPLTPFKSGLEINGITGDLEIKVLEIDGGPRSTPSSSAHSRSICNTSRQLLSQPNALQRVSHWRTIVRFASAPSTRAITPSSLRTEASDLRPNPTSTASVSSDTAGTMLEAWPHAMNAATCTASSVVRSLEGRDKVVHDVVPSRRFFA
ncbi:hypothetical protein HPB50_021708 [Hyalomma asiaticum]|uniref:Uncharacterized protein n=1 Tax=Hyalomma asiaticum TaxID=266040 RepID=A0ACB7RVM5_HYAAI|nr:hypothetical protein HPB50_021708 [Hyalomma asiaticum]